MKIFVISSYFETDRRKIQKNINKAVSAGVRILNKGHLPFTPQSMFAFWEKMVDKEQIMKACFKWIENCDAVFVLNVGTKGGGTSKALEYAKKLKKLIFYSINKIPNEQNRARKK